jgi:hypothetical protein
VKLSQRPSTTELSEYHQPRLEQMLLVLSSISSHTNALSLTSSASPHQSPGERAVANLLRLVLYPQGHHAGVGPGGLGLVGGVPGGRGDHTIAHLPSFLSGGAPRDRRGRVARKSLHLKVQQLLEGGKGGGGAMDDAERERDRELLEQLKSPDVPETPNIPGIIVDNATGWGSNVPKENRPLAGYAVDDQEEEEDRDGADGGLGSLRAAMAIGGGGEGTPTPNWQQSDERMDNWDEAQDVVERMVGMKGDNTPATPTGATIRQGR